MGRRIEELVREEGELSKEYEVARVVKSYEELIKSDLEGLIAVDFSSPENILKNIDFYIERGLRAVVGTTGWSSEVESVRSRVLEKGGSLLYGANFSIGVHLFLKMMEASLSLMKNQEPYHLFLREVHHRHKKDSPSGTGLEMLNLVKKMAPDKKTVLGIKEGGLEKEEISLVSQRGGEIVGFHEATFDSAFDAIVLSHNAKTRDGFCYGALYCAKWLSSRGGFFTVEDYLEDSFFKK